MKIEINHNLTSNTYDWKMWDGPDGVDEDSFVCRNLGECFEQIIMWRTLNAQQYVGETEND
jgi:hypothetical protein